MIILHAIREAASEREVYALLNAYWEAVEVGRAAQRPHEETPSGLADVEAVTQQIEVLVTALQEASRKLDDRARLLIKEVLHVFCAALDRLERLRDASQCVAAAQREIAAAACA